MLLMSTVAVGSLITLSEKILNAPLNFGLAAVVVLPMLLASRSCGAAWAFAKQQNAKPSVVIGYGFWFALLALLLAVSGALILHQFHLLDLPSNSALSHFASYPLESLSIMALALGSSTLTTAAGFILGARAERRLMPNK